MQTIHHRRRVQPRPWRRPEQYRARRQLFRKHKPSPEQKSAGGRASCFRLSSAATTGPYFTFVPTEISTSRPSPCHRPPRFVVDLHGVTNRSGLGTLTAETEFVEKVRVAQFRQPPEAIARVVFDLKSAEVPLVETGTGELLVRFAQRSATSFCCCRCGRADPSACGTRCTRPPSGRGCERKRARAGSCSGQFGPSAGTGASRYRPIVSCRAERAQHHHRGTRGFDCRAHSATG